MKKYISVTTVSILLLVLFALPGQSLAQWSIGASYQIRNEDPENGFGVRVERSVLGKAPVVDVGLRAHFSYFSAENEISLEGISIGDGTITNYDYGLSAIGGVNVGLIKPYVGLGIGSNTFEIDIDNGDDNSDSMFYWNALIGAEISPIPVVKPFVEYQFHQLAEPELGPGSAERLVFGISIAL